MRVVFCWAVVICAVLSVQPAALAQCGITFSPSSGAPAAAAGNSTVTVTVSGTASSSNSCARIISSNNPEWLTVSFGQTGSGSGGSFGYTVSDNLSSQPRTGTITVMFTGSGTTATYTVRQAGASCSYTFSPTSITLVAKNPLSFQFQVNTKCMWTISTTADWLTLSSNGPFTGAGMITISASSNTGTSTRRATLTINDQTVQVQQSGVVCAYAVTPALLNIPSDGGTAKFSVNTDGACSWSTTNTAAWISIPTGSVSGPGTLAATVSPNTTPQARKATLTIAGQQTVSITQAGVGISFTADSIQNASSFAGGALSPGEIFVIYGSGMGPQDLVTLQTTPDGQAITSSLGMTRVLFDGIPSPMIYTSSTQVSAIVPYGVLGPVAHMTVEYQGVASAPVTVSVLPATPGIFTISQTGTGQGAVRNQDFSVNGPDNAETAGRALVVYWTGGGVLSQPVGDGVLVSVNPPYPVVTFPVTAMLGTVQAQVLYVGAVPTLAPGILQLNLLIPDNAPRGFSVPLLLRVGDYTTQSGVTVAIR